MALRILARIGGRELRHPLTPGEHRLGSAADNTLLLPDPTISRHHACIQVDADGKATLRDLGSRNGCWIGSRRLEGELTLAPGQSLRLGDVPVEVQAMEAGDAQAALPGWQAATAAPTKVGATLATAPRQAFCGGALPRLLQSAANGDDWTRVAASALQDLVDCAARGACLEQDGALLLQAGEPRGETSEAERDRLRLRLHAREDAPGAHHLQPLAECVLDLLLLARRPYRQTRGQAREHVASATPSSPPSRHPAMRELYRQATIVAPSRLSVLIEGESGTGKELFARFLHAHSGLPEETFVALNCAALPRDLLDAELFGIESGVATGVGARAGKFELAHGGTLFLDEIADMAAETQSRLLRVLQEGEVYRIGGSRPRPAQVRVISACNRPLQGLVAAGGFRLDLYHRIADWSASLPPLRERGEDIGLLAAQFLERECRQRGIGYAGITRAALDSLNAYAWPGNVRELEREMMRVALFLNPGELVDSSLLKPDLRGARSEPGAAGSDGSLQGQLEVHERRIIESTLRDCNGQVLRAAERLGVGKSTLYRRIEALGIG